MRDAAIMPFSFTRREALMLTARGYATMPSRRARGQLAAAFLVPQPLRRRGNKGDSFEDFHYRARKGMMHCLAMLISPPPLFARRQRRSQLKHGRHRREL